MKTLYISDLDGTLLSEDKTLSDFTVSTVNSLTEKGMFFSVASARTASTALHMLKDIKFKLPVILVNGVLIFDTMKNEYVNIEYLGVENAEAVIKALKTANMSGLMYTVSNGKIFTYYENFDNPFLRDFVNERITKYSKKFTRVDSFFEIDSKETITFAFLDNYENISAVHGELSKIENIDITMHKDVYTDDLWCLECYAKTASKYNAVKFLREKYGFEKIVGFGDNLNDLPLFNACDEGYAVKNARDELKKIAAGIIGSNNEDGVARFLLENFNPDKDL